jgi:hypothetical protein
MTLFFALPGKSQDSLFAFPNKNEGYFLIFQLGYNKGAGKIKLTETTSTRNNGYMVSARATAGYFVEPSISLGLSFGLDGYHDPSFNLFPATLNFKYYLRPEGKTVFMNADIGYSLKLSQSFKSGAATDLSVGYRINSGKKVNVLLGTGINFQHIENANSFIYNIQTGSFEYVQSSFWLTTIAFNVGFLF